MNNHLNNSIDLGKETQSKLDFIFDPKARPIWEIAAEISAQIPDSEWVKVPTDLSKNFDKYQTKTARNEDKIKYKSYRVKVKSESSTRKREN